MPVTAGLIKFSTLGRALSVLTRYDVTPPREEGYGHGQGYGLPRAGPAISGLSI